MTREEILNKITNGALDLRGTAVTDADLAHLDGLTSLKVLYLTGTKVTNAGLVHLEDLVSLKELCLGSTKVNGHGVRKLQRMLPDCGIDR